MSQMFEILHDAMLKKRVVFIDNAFFTFCDKGDHVTSTNFFSIDGSATHKLLTRLEEIAAGRRIKISLNKDEAFAPEAVVLSRRGYKKTTSAKKTQHWENVDASHAA